MSYTHNIYMSKDPFPVSSAKWSYRIIKINRRKTCFASGALKRARLRIDSSPRLITSEAIRTTRRSIYSVDSRDWRRRVTRLGETANQRSAHFKVPRMGTQKLKLRSQSNVSSKQNGNSYQEKNSKKGRRFSI